jgi:predicted permease
MKNVFRGLRDLLRRRRLERDMQEEMRQHLERATERFEARGLSPEEARRAALREFGNVAWLQEKARDARGGRWLEAFSPDARLALRMLVKNPLLSIVGGLGMAVAIAIATGFFTFMTFYYSDPPVEDGDRVVSLEYIDGDDSRSRLFDYQLWKDELESFEELAAYRITRPYLTTEGGGAATIAVAEMTASGFRLARIPPLLGRPLLDSDELPGAPPVLVIGYREWQQTFGADPAVVGSEVRIDGTPHIIVGVMPEAFRLPMNHGFWTALENIASNGPEAGPPVRVFGRLASGVTKSVAKAEVVALADRLTALYPEVYERYRPKVLPYIRHLLDVQQYPSWAIWLMQLFAGLILVLVAVNVAVLVYARTALRTGEITVRAALGASRARIVSQLFVEALALSGVAAALGLGIAQLGFRQMTTLADLQDSLPYWLFDGLPAETIPYAVGVAVFAAFIVGVVPALQATGGRLQAKLRQLGGGSGLQMGKTWTVLICVQVAIAVGVLPPVVGIAWNEAPAPTPNYPASEVLSIRLQPSVLPSGSTAVDGQAPSIDYGTLQAELLRRVGAIPGVSGVTFASAQRAFVRVEIEHKANADIVRTAYATESYEVDIDYFDVFGVPLLAGRQFDRGDLQEGGSAAIVNRSFVDHYLGGGNALGRRFRRVIASANADGSERWFEIVGVVEDMLITAGRRPPIPSTYHPVDLGAASLRLAARVRGVEPASVGARTRELANEIAPGMEVAATTMEALYRGDDAERRFLRVMVGLITLSVLLLSAAGITAMMSFAVTRRRREIGVRTALGASRARMIASIFARSTRQLAIGALIGMGITALLDRISRGEWLGGQTVPVLTFVAGIMLLSGLIATLGPARRALRIQPMDALRED